MTMGPDEIKSFCTGKGAVNLIKWRGSHRIEENICHLYIWQKIIDRELKIPKYYKKQPNHKIGYGTEQGVFKKKNTNG